jgi:TonB-linked outer membrane protein, SusC/RagA family
MNPLIGPYADDEETMLNQAVTETENPLSMIYSNYIGSQTRRKKWFDATASLTYEIPWVKGLSVKGLFGYNYNLENYRQYRKKTYQYTYDKASDTYTQGVASRYNVNRYLHEQYFKTQKISQFVLNYNTKIDHHGLGATLIWESLWREGDNLYAQRELAFPKETMAAGVALNQQGGIRTGDSQYYERTNNALAGRVNYSFADKYLAEFQFRYDGSSIFAPGHRWGFFPSGSVAWRVSEEDFFKNSSLGFIEQLKLRTSYGITGDDTAGQYQYMTGYNYPLSANEERFSTGYMFNGSWVGSVSNRGIPNPNITWYKSKTFNLGIDFDAWNGLFGFTFEYFDRHRDGLLATRTGGIPTVVGASLPQENLNSDRHFGLELQLTHRNRVRDFSYRTSLMGTITRHQRLDYDERTFNSSRDKWLNSQSNRYQGIYWSQYGYDGQFQNWDQIWNYDVFTGSSTYPGNYYYVDWNGDGEINGWDNHPVYFNSTPLVNYSLSFSAAYKKFDLDILFQGSALGSLQYGEQIRGDSSTLEALLDRWHPKDPTADPYNPNTEWVKGYYAFNPRGQDNGTFNRVNTAYLRLKNIELGYNLPEYRSLKSRIFISGYNVFTLTKVRNYDPENPGGDSSYGFMYPHNKTLTLGLSLTF